MGNIVRWLLMIPVALIVALLAYWGTLEWFNPGLRNYGVLGEPDLNPSNFFSLGIFVFVGAWIAPRRLKAAMILSGVAVALVLFVSLLAETSPNVKMGLFIALSGIATGWSMVYSWLREKSFRTP